MQARIATRVATALVAFLLIVSPTAALTGAPARQSFTLGLQGAFTNVGSQLYSSDANRLVSASIVTPMGSLPVTDGATFYSHIDAAVEGMNTSGVAYFTFSQPAVPGTGGSPTVVQGALQIVAMVPAFCFTSGGSVDVNCSGDDVSAIPAFYVGVGALTVAVAPGPNGTMDLSGVPVLFESAYLNPFGNTLYIGTPDGSVSFAVRYSSALSQWTGVRTAGAAVASNSSGGVGSFSQTAGLTEDLYHGTENDYGQLTINGFTGGYSALNSAGSFQGTSIIPPASYDCTATLQAALSTLGMTLTLPPNSCAQTGSHSSGTFELTGVSARPSTAIGLLLNGAAPRPTSYVRGDYSLDWSIPALGFAGMATVTVGP